MLALTTIFNGDSNQTTEIKDALERIARAGFSHIHWVNRFLSFHIYSVYEMLQIKEWCDELKLTVKGIHAPEGELKSDLKSYVSLNQYNRLAGVEMIKNRIDMAHMLNTDSIVLHLPLPWKLFENNADLKKEFFRNALKTFDELESYCTAYRIRICVENSGSTPPEHTRYMFDTLFERYSADFVGFCFDTGHANIACKDNCLEYAERYNDRLYMIHIHDSLEGKGDHLIPFEGTFNWEGFAAVLARSPYQFPILMECTLKSEKYPPGEHSDWLKKAFEAGNRFSEMVQKYKG